MLPDAVVSECFAVEWISSTRLFDRSITALPLPSCFKIEVLHSHEWYDNVEGIGKESQGLIEYSLFSVKITNIGNVFAMLHIVILWTNKHANLICNYKIPFIVSPMKI